MQINERNRKIILVAVWAVLIALDAAEAPKAIEILQAQGERASVIGRVTDTGSVVIR